MPMGTSQDVGAGTRALLEDALVLVLELRCDRRNQEGVVVSANVDRAHPKVLGP